ncbi:hypothetical protein BMS3Abin11_01239 [bacterium BMS3Abin11]|nr:hypothetical protein BMS3Abin11_01239 [bacterium BMS3Abin11]
MTDQDVQNRKPYTGTSLAGIEGRRLPYISPKILSREKLESIAGLCTKSTAGVFTCDPVNGGVVSS